MWTRNYGRKLFCLVSLLTLVLLSSFPAKASALDYPPPVCTTEIPALPTNWLTTLKTYFSSRSITINWSDNSGSTRVSGLIGNVSGAGALSTGDYIMIQVVGGSTGTFYSNGDLVGSSDASKPLYAVKIHTDGTFVNQTGAEITYANTGGYNYWGMVSCVHGVHRYLGSGGSYAGNSINVPYPYAGSETWAGTTFDAAPTCEEPQIGTWPDCVDPSCEEGQTGTWPDCVDPTCEVGWTGTYPDCIEPPPVIPPDNTQITLRDIKLISGGIVAFIAYNFIKLFRWRL